MNSPLTRLPARPRRLDWGGVLTWTLVGYAVAFVVWATAFGHAEQTRTTVGDVAFLPVNLAAGILAWRASRATGMVRSRRAWRTLAIGFLSFWIGDVLWAYFELIRHSSPSPSAADIFYLAYYPLVLGGLLVLPLSRRERGDHVRFALDSTTVLLGGGMIVWYFVLRPTVLQHGGGALATSLSLAYPVGDLVLIFGVAWVLLHRCDTRARRPLAVLATGLVFFVVADTWYGAGSLNGSYASGGLNDAFWMIGQVLLVVAANEQRKASAIASAEPENAGVQTRATILLPYASVAGGYALLTAVSHPTVRTPVGGLLIGAMTLTALVVTRQVMVLRENARLVNALTALAETDELTGLVTRRRFGEIAEREFARSSRYDRPLSVLAIDVDHFKEVNDSLGHVAGDEVLREVALRCRAIMRVTDVLGRPGGDEFTALLPETWPEEALGIAKRLNEAVASRPVTTSRGPAHVSLSIGVANAESSRDVVALFVHADDALYKAKAAGRNQTAAYSREAAAV